MAKIINEGWEKDYCPNHMCQSNEIRHVWVSGRMLQYQCRECGTKSDPHKPELIPQEKNLVKHFFQPNSFGVWVYRIYDGYGHSTTLSRTYHSQEECEAALMKDLESHAKRLPEYGDCYGVIFPPSVEVKGTLYTYEKVTNDSGPVTTGS